MLGGAFASAPFGAIDGVAAAWDGTFSVSVPSTPSTLIIGTPTASFTVGSTFAVSVPGIGSTLQIGTPTASFSVPQLFSVQVPGLASALTIGVPTASFTRPSATGEPVTLEEARLAARVDADPDTGMSPLDDFIQGAITAAREQAEHVTGRTYRRRTIRFELEAWPVPDHRFSVCEPTACAISYFNEARQWQVLAADAFEFAPISGQAEIAPALDTSWPALGRRAVGALVRVDFTAGPADPSEVPEQVKVFIKAQVASWVNNPEALSGRTVQFNPLLERLLDAERLWH